MERHRRSPLWRPPPEARLQSHTRLAKKQKKHESKFRFKKKKKKEGKRVLPVFYLFLFFLPLCVIVAPPVV